MQEVAETDGPVGGTCESANWSVGLPQNSNDCHVEHNANKLSEIMSNEKWGYVDAAPFKVDITKLKVEQGLTISRYSICAEPFQ